MIDILLASRNQATVRTMIREQYAGLSSIYGKSMALIGRTILRNPNADKSSIIFMADVFDCLTCEFMLIEEMLNDGSANQAQERFSSIINRILMNDEASRAEYDNFELYLNVRLDMLANQEIWSNISNNNLYNLCQVSEQFTTWAGIHALGILNAHYGKLHFIPPAFRDSFSVRRIGETLDELSTSVVEVYPNPATDMVTISLDFKDFPDQPRFLKIFDITNRLVSEFVIDNSRTFLTIDTGQWQSGMYFFQIDIYHGLKTHGKFEILH